MPPQRATIVVSDVAITFAIVAAVVALFIWNRIPVALVALATPLGLYFTGVLTMHDALAGLGDPIVVFIASLFVVSAGLQAAGVTTWAGKMLAERAGLSPARLVVMVMLLAALVSALIGFIGTVAALLPVVVMIAARLGRSPSGLLMPLAFASAPGGLLTLTGSPVNMITYNAAQEAGLRPFGYFEFAIAGVPLLFGMIAIVLLFGRRLIPSRSGEALPADLSDHTQTLVEQYGLEDRLHTLRVRSTSPFVGAQPADIDLRGYPELALSLRGDNARAAGAANAAIAEGDMLQVRGTAAAAGRLALDLHLAFTPEGGSEGLAGRLFNRNSGLAEAIIPPRSPLVGKIVFPGMTTPDGSLIVLAVQRAGADLQTKPVTLAVGDHLLFQGTWQALDSRLGDPRILIIDSPQVLRQQGLALGPGAKSAIAVLIVLVGLLGTAAAPPSIAALVCACAMVLLSVLTIPQAYKGIDWTTVILIGGMIPLSTAMTQTGAADLLARQLLFLVGESGPHALLAGLFILTCGLGQLVSNTATALIIVPIGLAAAADAGIDPRPVLMSVTVAAAASFLTPVATPANLMVMGPGGYRFGDYWKLGVPCTLWFFVVAVFLVPLYWKF